MKGLKFSIFAAVFALAPALASADIFVSHFEPLSELAVQTGTTDAGNESRKIGPASRVSVRFDALGRRFDLQLQQNDRLMANLPAAVGSAMTVASRSPTCYRATTSSRLRPTSKTPSARKSM